VPSLRKRSESVCAAPCVYLRETAGGRINRFFFQDRGRQGAHDRLQEESGGSDLPGNGLTADDFSALVQDLVATLDKFHVKEQDKQARKTAS